MRRFAILIALMSFAREAGAEQCFTSTDEFNDFMKTQTASAASVTLSFTVTGVNLSDYFNGKGWLAEFRDSRCAAGSGSASLKVYGTSEPLNSSHPPGTMKLEYGSWCCAAPTCPAELWADPMPGDPPFSQPSQVCSVVEGLTPAAVSYDIQCAGEALHHAEGPNTDSMLIDQAAVLAEVGGGHAMTNATATNVKICFELGAAGSGGTGGSDGGSGCTASPINASLTPSDGSGAAQIFSIKYSHCDGAAAFRVVQAWVVDEIDANAPGINLGYEDGKLFGAGGTEQCTPGEAKVLAGTYGTLDCAKTTVTSSGNDVTVDWAIQFDTTKFAGTHGVWADAKGGSATPEPRLGWTKLGQFTVQPGPSGWSDGGGGITGNGSGGGAASLNGSGTTPADDSGCGCRLATSSGSKLAIFALGLLGACIRRRRGRRLELT